MMIRQPAVAGTFYPDDSIRLRAMVQEFLQATQAEPRSGAPKAIIAPHAGYIYSGPIAASAYGLIRPFRHHIKRVIILGPAHTMYLAGMATPRATAFATPLGAVPVAETAVAALTGLPQVNQMAAAHSREHGLEVHLPFLQELLAEFTIVPLVVGDCAPDDVAAVLRQVWGGPETLIVISSDLSHYLDYAAAQTMDQQTAVAIEGMQPHLLGENSACGRQAIKGLLLEAQERHLQCQRFDLRNSGDTAGPKNQVVGYGAWGFFAG